MSGFTPGPWHAMPHLGTWISTVGSPYGHGPMHIADVRGWGHLTGRGACGLDEAPAIAIQEANARLIAAAPDLLEALKQVSNAYGCFAGCTAALAGPGECKDHLYSCKVARVAFAKAGEGA